MGFADAFSQSGGQAVNPFAVALNRINEVKAENRKFQQTLEKEAVNLENVFKELGRQHENAVGLERVRGEEDRRLEQEKVRLEGRPIGTSPQGPVTGDAARGVLDAAGLAPQGRQVEVTPGENVFVPESPQDKKTRLQIEQLERELTPEGARRAGELKGITKGAEEEEKARVGAEQSLLETRGFVRSFEKALNETEKKFPSVGEPGPKGLVSRFLGKGAVKLDLLPETAAFIKNIKVRANQQARTIEGGRVTDKDREVYADALANVLGGPTAENVTLVADKLSDMGLKGADIEPTLRIFENSNTGVLKKIATQARKELQILKQSSNDFEEEFQLSDGTAVKIREK